MQSVEPGTVVKKSIQIPSAALGRSVRVDFYLPPRFQTGSVQVLLLNDGQDLEKMRFEPTLNQLFQSESLQPLLCLGIHAGPQRKLEYGTAHAPDYQNRGIYAREYTRFVIQELIPYIKEFLPGLRFSCWAFAGFSLGGLSAMDIGWSHPEIFTITGVFSGSLWWRSMDTKDPLYQDGTHRLMHNRIRNGKYAPGLRFFFECGTADEKEDRNHNGVIDSIDDTKDLIAELVQKGYSAEKDIYYLEVPGGTHDPGTWAKAMPHFLKWAWGKE
jgi:enterochelin esterase-like enzyme